MNKKRKLQIEKVLKKFNENLLLILVLLGLMFNIYFWADNDEEAKQEWEKQFKYEWSSMEYALEKIEKKSEKDVDASKDA